MERIVTHQKHTADCLSPGHTRACHPGGETQQCAHLRNPFTCSPLLSSPVDNQCWLLRWWISTWFLCKRKPMYVFFLSHSFHLLCCLWISSLVCSGSSFSLLCNAPLYSTIFYHKPQCVCHKKISHKPKLRSILCVLSKTSGACVCALGVPIKVGICF